MASFMYIVYCLTLYFVPGGECWLLPPDDTFLLPPGCGEQSRHHPGSQDKQVSAQTVRQTG